MSAMDPVLAANALADRPDLTSAGLFNLVGFVMVMIVLGSLAFLCVAVSRIIRLLETMQGRPATPAPAAAAPVPVAPAPVPVAPAPVGPSPELVAAIAAAVAVTVREAHRIIAIQPSAEGWASEGRRAIFSSHRVR